MNLTHVFIVIAAVLTCINVIIAWRIRKNTARALRLVIEARERVAEAYAEAARANELLAALRRSEGDGP